MQLQEMGRARMDMQCWASSAPHSVSPHRSAAKWAAPSAPPVSGWHHEGNTAGTRAQHDCILCGVNACKHSRLWDKQQ